MSHPWYEIKANSYFHIVYLEYDNHPWDGRDVVDIWKFNTSPITDHHVADCWRVTNGKYKVIGPILATAAIWNHLDSQYRITLLSDQELVEFLLET